MPAKGSCRFCRSARRAELEDAIRTKRMSQREAGEVLGQATSGVSTHMSSHGAAPIDPGALRMPAPPPSLAGTPTGRMLAELAEIHDGALERYRAALKDGSLRDLSQLATVLRRNLDRRRELEEMSRPPDPDAWDVLRDPVLAGLRDRLAEALRPWPEATEAVIGVLRQ